MEDVLVPIAMFAAIAVILCLFFWFRFRARGEIQQTLRAALDKDLALSADLIDRLGHPKPSKNRDLRFAIIWLSLAVGLALCGIAIGDTDTIRGTLAGAAFPLCIGVGFLIIWRFVDRD